MLKIAYKHPQAYWNCYPLLREGSDLGQDFITGLLSCPNGCNAIFICVDHLIKYTILTACILGAGDLSAKQAA